jgi:archaellin
MPSFLLCFMQQLAADKMAGPSPVTYLALIDEDACNASSQVASGAQVETKAAAASAKAGESTVNYKKVTVTVSQASGNDPMNVKAWVPVEGGMTVYTYGSAVKPVSETNIFGEFSFVYTGRVDGLGDVLKGQMSASGSQIIWSQTEYIPEAEQWFDWKATINIGSGTSGNGAVQHIGSAGTIDISSYAYTEDNFCRQLKLRNGSAISADEECFFTDELKGKKTGV